MNVLPLFVLEILLCLGISLALIFTLKPLLRDVLAETCGTENRAAFWIGFTQLMLIISPLLLVIYFAPTEPDTAINLVRELQLALFRTLLGNFIALSFIGQVIWKSVANRDRQAPVASRPLEN